MTTRPVIVVTSKAAQKHLEDVKIKHADILKGLNEQTAINNYTSAGPPGQDLAGTATSAINFAATQQLNAVVTGNGCSLIYYDIIVNP